MPSAGETTRSAAEAVALGLRALAASESPRLDAEILLAHTLGIPRSQLFARAGVPLSAGQWAGYELMLERRRAGEPIAYVTGSWEFWSLPLAVSPAVLVPRPETELLVEWALELLPKAMPTTAADLGTGSGAIALALAHERPQAEISAIDISPAALDVARGNAQSLGLANVAFRQADFALWLASAPLHDLIVSNPPYVAQGDPHLRDLAREPELALVAGADGLDCLRSIGNNARRALRSGGGLLLEHGYDQGAVVREILRKAGFVDIETRHDLSGHERATGARRK